MGYQALICMLCSEHSWVQLISISHRSRLSRSQTNVLAGYQTLDHTSLSNFGFQCLTDHNVTSDSSAGGNFSWASHRTLDAKKEARKHLNQKHKLFDIRNQLRMQFWPNLLTWFEPHSKLAVRIIHKDANFHTFYVDDIVDVFMH